MWCPAYVESEQALLNTTEVTQQQCSVSFGWQPTNDLTSLPVDLWGAGPRNESWVWPEMGMPGQAAQMMGQQQQKRKTLVLYVKTTASTKLLRPRQRPTMLRPWSFMLRPRQVPNYVKTTAKTKLC